MVGNFISLDFAGQRSRRIQYCPKSEWTLVMVRTDDDSWDITESVGATALGVAMARAAESDCDCPLFTDRYAQPFVDAAVKRGWDSSLIGARLPMIKGYAAVRTKWFDEYFIAAGANGINQAVILAAGLDARAWRLPWVTGSAIYEIDQPQVLAFKAGSRRSRGEPDAAFTTGRRMATSRMWLRAAYSSKAGCTPRTGPLDGYCESWNSITAATESTASLSAANRSAAVGAASTE